LVRQSDAAVISFDIASACDPGLLRDLQRALPCLPAGTAVGVALSAGSDSAMLALHAAQAARARGWVIHCFHVHHGLQAEADAWLCQAHRLAALLGVSCHSRRVRVDAQGLGMEAAAREARYEALAELASLAGVGHVLLAHHLDDQAETVLLRLLRGAGPEGLAAMAPATLRDGLVYHRPWLDEPRARILACAARFTAETGWRPVQDPSNGDTRYARAMVRAQLAPMLDARWPAWRRTLGRHARQARELVSWQTDASAKDFAGLDPAPDGRSFSLSAWRALPAVAQAPVLRYWLRQLGLRMPSDARLQAWLRQFREVHALGHDRAVRLRHVDVWIVVQRGRVTVVNAS
jgi:tRNA(Ile)-lysidine synthase